MSSSDAIDSAHPRCPACRVDGTRWPGRDYGDQLHFRYQGVVGNFEISCRIATTENLSALGRVGLMARENMDGTAVCAAVGCAERVYRTTDFRAREQPGDPMALVGTSDR